MTARLVGSGRRMEVDWDERRAERRSMEAAGPEEEPGI